MEQYFIRLSRADALRWDGLSPTASWVHVRHVSDNGVVSFEQIVPGVIEAGSDGNEVVVARTSDGKLWENSNGTVRHAISPEQLGSIHLQSPSNLAATRSAIELQPWRYNVYNGRVAMLTDTATSQFIVVILFLITFVIVRSRWRRLASGSIWVTTVLTVIVLTFGSDGDISITTALATSVVVTILLRKLRPTLLRKDVLNSREGLPMVS